MLVVNESHAANKELYIMSTVWTDDEVSLLETLRPVCTTREILQVFEQLAYDRSAEAIAKKARCLGMQFNDLGTPSLHALSEEELAAVEEMILDREDALNAMEPPVVLTPSEKGSQTLTLRKEVGDLHQRLQEVRQQVPRRSSVSHKIAKGSHPSIVLMLSDHHIGKKVTNENHELVFNMQIAIDRIISIPELLLDQLPIEDLKSADEIVVLLIGDHVDGEDIFPHQNIHLESHVADQVLTVTKAHWNLLRSLRVMFPLVRVITARGNHGRSGGSPESNWDNIFYQHLALLVDMENDPNLVIRNKYGEFSNFMVKEWRGHMRHKAPVQCDTAASRDKFAGWRDIHNYDFMCYGHWHHWGVHTYNGRPIFRNGSLSGGDDYSETFGSSDNPNQVVFGVTPDKIGTFITPLVFK